MKKDFAEINSKGHIVIPKEIRQQFHFVPGSKVEIEVEGDRINLIPHSLVDAMEKIIVGTLKKAGLKPDAASLNQYHSAMKIAFDNIKSDVADENVENTDPAPVKKVRQPKKN
ncbi:MAG: AbrB/MazE/SpoVT family DNA-binding domain-containing protein [Negativicutes bacterium]